MDSKLKLLEAIGLVGAALWAAATFSLARKRELAFHRTEFIVRQSEYLDNDREMREGTLILYGMHPLWTIENYLEVPSKPSEQQGEMVIKFEKYLNFLWRIAYAHYELGTLTSKDLDAFGAYFYAVGNHVGLRDFCKSEGYGEIVKAFDDLSKKWALEEGLREGPDPNWELERTSSNRSLPTSGVEERTDS
jgi:hypothetical protein